MALLVVFTWPFTNCFTWPLYKLAMALPKEMFNVFMLVALSEVLFAVFLILFKLFDTTLF